MTAEKYSVIGVIIAILLFIIMGIKFSYEGFKKWKGVDGTEPSRVKWGKFEFYLGIVLAILAIVCVVVLIRLVKENIIFEPGETIEIVEPLETIASDEPTDNDFVTNLKFRGADYSGYVNESRQPNGEGTMTWSSDGSEYTGDWVDGIRQGQGTMKYNNGVYVGEWQNDKKNGKGTYTWNDGKKYEGEYVDDVRNGEGIFSGWEDLTNGYSGTYYGQSQNDQFNGYGCFLFDNGDRFEGVYKENLYWTGIYTKKDGSWYEIVNGQEQ